MPTMPSDVPHPRGGKFQSKAQQRLWFARYGEKAGRQVAHNTAPKGYKGKHPIDAAGIPNRVGKADLNIAGEMNRLGGVFRGSNGRSAGIARNKARVFAQRKRFDLAQRAQAVADSASARARANGSVGKRYASGTAVGKRLDVDEMGVINKGVLTQGVKPVLARRAPLVATGALAKAPRPARQIIGKAGFGEALKVARKAPEVARAGFRQGAKGAAKPKMSLGAASMLPGSKTLQRVGQAGKITAENRGLVGLSTGIVGGSVMGAGLARRDDDVNKAHGDPEDARYYRLGMGSAGLAGVGAGGLAYAGRDVKRATRLARTGSPGAVHNFKNKTLVTFDNEELARAKGKPSVRAHGTMLEPKLVHTADRLGRSGYGITRRGALVGAGGLAALGGAEVLRRKAHERRWN